jgi:hypothetical protein
MIKNYVRMVTGFQWFLLTVFLLAQMARWVVPYVMALQDVRRNEACESFFRVFPYVVWAIGIGIVLDCAGRDRKCELKRRCWFALGMMAVLGSMLGLRRMSPDPWAYGHFHRLTSNIAPEKLRGIVKQARAEYDPSKDLVGRIEELDRVWEKLAQADPAVQEFINIWWEPQLNLRSRSTGVVWSDGMFSRHWGIIVLDDPTQKIPDPSSLDQWEWVPGLYFWMQR